MPKNFFLAYWKTIVVCVLIFVLSTVTFKSIPHAPRFHNGDKLIHALMYAGLGFIAYYEYKKENFFRAKYKYWLLYIFLFFVFFGGIIEILQENFFKPRTAEFADWIADIVGLIAGLVVGILFIKLKKQE